MLQLKPYPLGSRAIFGMITPGHDTGYGCYEFREMCPDGVVTLTARAMVRSLKVNELQRASQDAVNEAEKLATAHCNVINYIATATCFVLGNDGEDYLVKQMEDKTGIPCTSGGKAVSEALKFMNAQKILCFTPYGVPEVAETCRKYFRHDGFEIVGEENMSFVNPGDVNNVDPLTILAHIVRLKEEHPEAEGVFCVGGCFRTLGIVEDLERIIGIPVVGTQQANMWKCLQMARINDPLPQFGRLLGASRV